MNKKLIAFYEARAKQLVLEILPRFIYTEHVPLTIRGATSAEQVPFTQVKDLKLRPFQEGDTWGSKWSSAWFRLEGEVPKAWAGRQVVAWLQFGGEACVFSEAGEPLQGLTNGSVFFSNIVRERYQLFAACKGGEKVSLLVEAAANDMFGIFRGLHPLPQIDQTEHYNPKIEKARLAIFDEALWHAWLDARTLFRLMESLPENSPWRAQILAALIAASDGLDHAKPDGGKLRQIFAPCLARRGGDDELTAIAIGHAHIDTAWLWPVRESVRKCGRTFANQLRLIERYPEYVFGASQAQHYQFVKDRYPLLYKKIQAAVKAGRWEIQGAMWVEADANLTGGESLVRQVLYGKRFFRQEFGVDVRNLWLPDVFGYSAALPQILRQAGVDCFLTQKMSWSQFNKFPHHSFVWKGIDGSEVLAHFPPEDNYNSELNPAKLRAAQENFEEKGFLPEFMSLFGVGDGGGGPLDEHLESALRLARLPGCPRVKFGAAQPFFERLKKQRSKLATWSGELYLELHRGTLTSQAQNKRFNRRCELALRRVELLWSALPMAKYPGKELEALWKIVLKNQFHDIIPGSSIREVYEDSRADYAEVLAALDKLEAKALRALGKAGTAKDISIVNPLSHEIHAVVELPGICNGSLESEDGQRFLIQRAGGSGWAEVIVPAMGAATFQAVKATVAPEDPVTATESVLENALVRYEFDPQGRLVRMLDKVQGREMIRLGEAGNVISIYEDWPNYWDAWDVEIAYEQQHRGEAKLVNRRLVSRGPVVAELEMTFAIGNSTIRQIARLATGSKRLDFITTVEWNECRKMLRTAFMVDVEAAEASYEIQYGLVKRPTHRNTSWDLARFEVCGHRFADLSDRDGGVALMNNCKYGYKVFGRTLDLNLLRSPHYPDATADRGSHSFTYSVYPHEGAVEASDVVAEAHLLNQSPLMVPGALDFRLPFALFSAGVLVETVKKAEDADAWIVRLYEPVGRHAAALCRVENAILHEATLLEEKGKKLRIDRDGSCELTFRPFEIKTLMIVPAGRR
jgi:alpha-mannosidase